MRPFASVPVGSAAKSSVVAPEAKSSGPMGVKDCLTKRSCEETKGEGRQGLIIFIRINLIRTT